MKFNFYSFIILISLLFTACMGTMDNISVSENEGDAQTDIKNGIVLAFGNQQNTKLEYNDAMQIVWSEGDVMGVYAKNGHEFPNKPYAITEGIGKNVAYFENNSIVWAPNHEVTNPEKYSFYFYFPYTESAYIQTKNDEYIAHKNLNVSLPSIQYQTAANNSDHFSKYRLMASYKDAVWVTEGAHVVGGFTFASVVSVFEFIPNCLADGQKIVSITLNGTEESDPFAFEKAILDLEAFKQGENPLKVIEGSKQLTLSIGNGGIGNGESAYMVIAPGNAGKQYTISYTTNDGKTYERIKKGSSSSLTSKAAGYKPDVRYIFKIEEKTEIDQPIRIDARERANCYVVNRGLGNTGDVFSFNVQYEGNSNDLVGTSSNTKDKDIYGVKLVWGSSEVDPSSLKISSDKTMVTFSTKENASGNGNAVIAVVNKNNEILWSWHIWVTDYDPYKVNVTVDGKTFMDRNLGADANTNDASGAGMYYQWGRKDPFPAKFAEVQKKSVKGISAEDLPAMSIANPSVFYFNNGSEGWRGSDKEASWGANKTKFDPCPAGWRVPEDGAFSFMTVKTATFSTNAISYEDFNLVAAGCLTDEGQAANMNRRGFYWSCEATSIPSSFYTYFCTTNNHEVKTKGNIGTNLEHSRANGFAVRCIAEDVNF